ncbi:hypothetical protein SCHPADRAFT_980610 [Schizopora paradoxa]|uniref:Uncharacterized protein n=1 Tax=Schizopora paradoxa TaxID=27342 RepID=A0A0H2RB48_9AGAM|nr:hypothetical protein SCHPADRAFT_980610 [Schizopora paradoxa]
MANSNVSSPELEKSQAVEFNPLTRIYQAKTHSGGATPGLSRQPAWNVNIYVLLWTTAARLKDSPKAPGKILSPLLENNSGPLVVPAFPLWNPQVASRPGFYPHESFRLGVANLLSIRLATRMRIEPQQSSAPANSVNDTSKTSFANIPSFGISSASTMLARQLTSLDAVLREANPSSKSYVLREAEDYRLPRRLFAKFAD